MDRKLALFVLLLIFGAAIAAPQAQSLDLPVSPQSDPDPRSDSTIAVSPADERIIVGASKVLVGGGGPSASGTSRVAYYFSSDGGATWGNSLLGLETPQKTWGRTATPSVAADLDGNFYLSVLMLDNSSLDSGIYVFKSTDGGQSFKDPVPVSLYINNASAKLINKPYVTVDRSASSPFKNTLYVVWATNDIPDNSGNFVVRIAHRRPGQFEFSEPRTVSHRGDMRGPSAATGPGGELYAVWEGIGTPRVLLFNASTDGGETWLPAEAAPSIDLNIHNFTGNLSQPSPAMSITGVTRMNSFPVMDVDRSAGPNRGKIYIAWAETTNRADADIFVKRLTPPGGGRPDVSPPLRVNNDGAGADQFFPWLSVDDTSGAVEVAFYDRRDNPGDAMVDIFVARSTDGGSSFTDNRKVSQQKSDPRVQARVRTLPNGIEIGIGDYIALAAARGKAHVLWTDTRRGKQEIFYGQVPFETSGGGGGGGGGEAPINDNCLTPRVIEGRPYLDSFDTASATTSEDDPVSCSGSRDAHSVWYSFTSSANTVYGIEAAAAGYDTVLSVYTGNCGALVPIACSDDFGAAIGNLSRSLLTFAAGAGVTYLIEVSGKGSGGILRIRFGAPTVTGIEYTKGPDGKDSLKITGAGFVDGSARVKVKKDDGSETVLSTVTFAGERQGDGTVTSLFATKKKLKKLIKRGRTVEVIVESPAAGSGGGSVESIPYLFTRP